jgi:hypothetical protein
MNQKFLATAEKVGAGGTALVVLRRSSRTEQFFDEAKTTHITHAHRVSNLPVIDLLARLLELLNTVYPQPYPLSLFSLFGIAYSTLAGSFAVPTPPQAMTCPR